jgi:glyoxylase-like metal-dependent hydrolase (beta-lactamase superfamily II)
MNIPPDGEVALAADRHAWIEEGAHLVAPGVHRIPLPLPSDALRAVNVYAIESAGGLVLIDSGWALAVALDQLKRSLATIGAGLPDVRKFLVTHLHRDHFTQAVEIRRLFGTPVALGTEEQHSIGRLMSADFRPLDAQLTALEANGAGDLARQLAEFTITEISGDGALARIGGGSETGTAPRSTAQAAGPGDPGRQPATTLAAKFGYAPPDEWITAGQELDLGTRTLTAIPTPGHTRGHLVFADAAAGLLFAGDHVLPHITPSIGFEEAPPALPLGDYLQSLNVVRQLPDMRLLPAHGPVSPSTHARVDELAEHHARRLELMAAVLAAGPATGYDVALAIGWTSRQSKLGDLDVMNQMLAVCETIYHLDLLVAQSTALCLTGEDGIRRYQLAPRDEEISA